MNDPAPDHPPGARPLVYSCSGCSSAAQLANHVAVQLDRRGVAEMSCIAGVGGDVPKLVALAQSGRPIVALDGCPLVCVKSSLARHGITPARHYQLHEYGEKTQPPGLRPRPGRRGAGPGRSRPDRPPAAQRGRASTLPRRVIVGISGASGAVYGARLLQALREIGNVESHLVVSDGGWRNLRHELDMDRASVEALADVVHDLANVGASIASGSFAAHGMVVAPCSMRTLAAVAHGLADNPLTRAADVVLKERRRLVLMVRGIPCTNMATVTETGGIVGEIAGHSGHARSTC